MSNLSDINISNVLPQETYKPYPAGDYVMQVIQSERKWNKAGTGEFLELQMEILDGEYTGRKYFERLNLWHPSDNVRDIALRSLSGLAHATGKQTLGDSKELEFIPFVGVMRVTKRKDTGELQNQISFRSLNSTPTPAPVHVQQSAPPVSTGGKPWERHKRTA